MKSIFIILSFLFLGIAISAQSDFDKSIQKNKSLIEKTKSTSELDAIFVELDQLTRTTDTNKWEAYYFAGLAQYKKAEILLSENNLQVASIANALAYKYISGGVPTNESSGKKLIELIINQKKKLGSS